MWGLWSELLLYMWRYRKIVCLWMCVYSEPEVWGHPLLYPNVRSQSVYTFLAFNFGLALFRPNPLFRLCPNLQTSSPVSKFQSQLKCYASWQLVSGILLRQDLNFFSWLVSDDQAKNFGRPLSFFFFAILLQLWNDKIFGLVSDD